MVNMEQLKSLLTYFGGKKFGGAVVVTALASYFLQIDKINGEIWAWLIWGVFATYCGVNVWQDKVFGSRNSGPAT